MLPADYLFCGLFMDNDFKLQSHGLRRRLDAALTRALELTHMECAIEDEVLKYPFGFTLPSVVRSCTRCGRPLMNL